MPEGGRGESDPGPARLDEALDTKEGLFADDRGRFVPGAFAAYLRTRFDFATLSDTEEILVYDLDRGVYVKAEARIKGWLQAVMGESASAHGANETLGHVQRATYLLRNEFNPAGFLCLENGVLELNPLKVWPHGPEPRFTRQLPVVFDPEATCPAFLRFLEQVLPDSELRVIVQLLFGYCLKAGNWLQLAFLLWGGGNNGKSTLLRILAALLGLDAVAARTLQALSSDKFAKASLYGKLANICPDLPAAPIAYTGTFKGLTGGDPVTGERKYQNEFTFINEAVLIFSANQRPPVDDPTVAFWRRWVIIPFGVNFEGREDHHLLEKLTTP
ncbi:MAG: phage/plasmid primase, P4 family, partial [Thermoplasmata archaeon]